MATKSEDSNSCSGSSGLKGVATAKISHTDFRKLELHIEKIRAGVDQELAAPLSTAATFCTVNTISSVSCVCTINENSADADPEVAQAIFVLHKRAIEVLGEEVAIKAVRSRCDQQITG